MKGKATKFIFEQAQGDDLKALENQSLVKTMFRCMGRYFRLIFNNQAAEAPIVRCCERKMCAWRKQRIGIASSFAMLNNDDIGRKKILQSIWKKYFAFIVGSKDHLQTIMKVDFDMAIDRWCPSLYDIVYTLYGYS